MTVCNLPSGKDSMSDEGGIRVVEQPLSIGLAIRHNPEDGMFELWDGGKAPLVSTDNALFFQKAVDSLVIERLKSLASKEVEGALLALFKTVPYPQECQCQSYPTHQALDCHVHMENPRHFFVDFDFPCTCS